MTTLLAQDASAALGARRAGRLGSQWQGVVVALITTTATLAFRLELTAGVGTTPMLVIFTAPIAVSSYVGGLLPGLLATALSCLFAAFYLLTPVHSFAVAAGAERWDLLFVALAGLTISVVNDALHRAHRRAGIIANKLQRAESVLLTLGPLQTAIFNSASFSCIATDSHGIIQLFNVGAERLFGFRAADVVNRITPADLHDPQDVVARAIALSLEYDTEITPGFEALVFRASRGIEDLFEVTEIRKDGTRFPALLSVTALRDAHDAIFGYLLIALDNSARQQVEAERQRAEEARRVSEIRYRALFENAPDGILVADRDSRYLDVNDSICRMLGYTREQLIGLHAADIVAESEVANIEPALAEIRAAGAYHHEWRLRRQNGSTFAAEAIVTVMPDGNLLAMIRDITERKHTDEQSADALRELSDVKAALDEHAIVAVTNSKGKITYVNDKFCAISQYSRAELLGKDHRIINSGHHPKAFIRGIWETISTGRVWKGEIKNRAKDGTYYWVDTTIVPYLGESGKPVQYIAIRTDITERKSFEAALQQKNVELEDASRMKSDFLANMSHELRTPLNSIIGFSDVLRDGLLGDMTEQQRGFIGDISGSGNHLLSLINDILDLSKVEAGKMELDLEPVEIAPLFQNSLSILREKAARNQIHVELDASDAVGSIEADPRKVKQIVYNLLSNAIKFSSSEGRVLLRARRVSRADVGKLGGGWPHRVFALAESDFEQFIEIVVHDDGIGISPEGLTQLFTPFSQIDSGLARKFEGTGLGLAMVKLLAELHGGTMAVESIVGKGSSFTVWLPVRGQEERAPVVGGVPEAPRFGALTGGRVALVVEGDPKSAELIRVQLVAEGFEVLHAATAEAALLLAVQQPLSLITLDIMLPQMDGWEFLSRIRRVPALRRVPVMIISIVADRTRGFALGAAAVMEKPISRQQLFEALADLGVIPVSPGKTLKVLVADDDPSAIELIAQRVERFAATVLRAYGGQEAIDLARRELPDVIILDLMMPEVSGFGVVEALREQPATACIPILVVTAKWITDEDRARLNGYVSTIMAKTEFGLEHFSSEIRRAMAGRHVEV